MAKKSSLKKETKQKIRNKSKENKFKKIILSVWFWVIVALVSLFIMGSTPIDSSFGLFLAYLTPIAWIIVVVLIMVNIIKWIQKSSIGDYWKISFTILGIVGIIAYVFYAISGVGIFDKFTYSSDKRIGESDNDKIRLIKIHIGFLEEEGYEVLYFGLLLEDTEAESAYIKMKSLGSKNKQVWEGLTSLTRVYPDALEYSILILEESQSCWYTIGEKLWKGYSGEGKYTLDGKNLTKLDFYSVINYQIDNPSCS